MTSANFIYLRVANLQTYSIKIFVICVPPPRLVSRELEGLQCRRCRGNLVPVSAVAVGGFAQILPSLALGAQLGSNLFPKIRNSKS